MSVGAIGGSAPYASPQVAGKPEKNDEIIVRAAKCDKKECEGKPEHVNGTCSSATTTKPAPKAGENGYLFDETV